MLIVGGTDWSNDKTQSIDFSNETKSCENWENYPIPILEATGAMVEGK